MSGCHQDLQWLTPIIPSIYGKAQSKVFFFLFNFRIHFLCFIQNLHLGTHKNTFSVKNIWVVAGFSFFSSEGLFCCFLVEIAPFKSKFVGWMVYCIFDLQSVKRDLVLTPTKPSNALVNLRPWPCLVLPTNLSFPF